MFIGCIDMDTHWYALRSKPNKEAALWGEICARGYDGFFPQLKVQPVNPRSRKIRPYFPGYMFVHVDLSAVGFSALAWLPYSHGLVTFGSEPSPVPEELIHTLQNHLERINALGGEIFDGLKHGDPVRVDAGPFAGYDAIFDVRVAGSERVRVLLKLIQKRQIPVELPASYIRNLRKR
jgi:transcription antitermination factor NusG